MAPRKILPADVADLLPRGGLVWLQGCSAESVPLREALECAGARLAGTTFTGIFVPGLNRVAYAAADGRRVRTFFMTPELAKAGGRVDFLPLCYRDLREHLRKAKIGAALFMVSPPDESGRCSFGPVVDFLAELWPAIPVRIAHINPRLPRTPGDPGIPYADLTAVVEAEQELPVSSPGTDEANRRIGANLAPFIADGSTIQAGLGRTPETVLSTLTGHRGLGIHSGLIGDSTVDLLEAGALRDPAPIVAGVAIGTRRLYDAIGSEYFRFMPVRHTHSTPVLAAIERLVTINSAIEVDLLGQAYAERTPRGFISGPGGACDFAVGARTGGGLRIVALPASAGEGKASRIVGPGAGSGPVSLGRFDVDLVATENGVADLRGKSHQARAEALLAVAAEDHRDRLANEWHAWMNGETGN